MSTGGEVMGGGSRQKGGCSIKDSENIGDDGLYGVGASGFDGVGGTCNWCC